MKLTILACQIHIPPTPTAEAKAAHLQCLVDLVEAHLAQQAVDLVVLPELSTIDYSRESFGNLADLGEDLDGPSFQAWSQVAKRHGCHILYGLARQNTENKHRISQALINAAGNPAGHYDKIFLAQFGASMEKDFFQPGETVFAFNIKGVKVAPIICADIRFPELCRHLTTDLGAELILHCGAYYRDNSFASWHDFVKTRAMENQLFFLSLNRAGIDYGASLFCPPLLTGADFEGPTEPIAFDQHAEELRFLTLDFDEVQTARSTFPFLQDRRVF